jgi:hypothetical protein
VPGKKKKMENGAMDRIGNSRLFQSPMLQILAPQKFGGGGGTL